MDDKDLDKDNSSTNGASPNPAPNDAAQNLADDPILNASSINSEDYWFLKLSGNDK
ncbi:hypothetical protein [Fibrobacter sp.]|uniref:hypothetical protein n=1 Tax=Fibrobacter sp. TaxID=35828 RepID=UPI001B276E47|nr:hypothetical protein [Fibrobacter sp.]MBO7059942.1 hypothetical protein [Fibrobacter sp.]MBO7105450.1 hypothetical protein [Fibrobacter sp.]MBR3669654.1 hypothetical protein [Fibrobacter sp.]